MGERAAPELRPVAWWRHRPATFWLLPALVLGVVCLAPWRPGASFDQVEVTEVLAAESVVHDADLEHGPEDAARWEAWSERVDGLPAPRLADGRYVTSFASTVALAPAALTGGVRVMLFWQALFFAVVAIASAVALARVAGPGASGAMAVFLFGSVAFAHVFRLWPQTTIFLLIAGAFALVRGVDRPSVTLPPDLYPELEGERGWRFAARWIGVGVLLGLAVAADPIYLPLLLPALFAVPGDRRVVGGSLLLGPVFVLASFAYLAGVMAPLSSGDLALEELLDRDLWLWEIVSLAVGRHGGKLLYFLPLVLVVDPGRVKARLPTFAAVALITFGWLGLRPFDAGFPEAFGHPLLITLFPLGWYLTTEHASRWRRGLAWGLAAVVLWPLWIGPLGATVDEDGRARWVAPYLGPWLPAETIFRDVPLGPVVTKDEATIWIPSGPAWSGDRGGEIVLMGSGRFELLIASARPLDAVRFEAPEAVGADLEIRGGELGETMLRPDGGTGFLVRLPDRVFGHPAPGRPGTTYWRRLSLQFPGARQRPSTIRVTSIVPRLEVGGP